MIVAETIRQQIGNKALFMMGAKDLRGDDNSLTFNIGRNSFGVNVIQIKLNSMDLYDVTFYRLRKLELTEKSKAEGVYFDMLHAIIEKNTGMYLSL